MSTLVACSSSPYDFNQDFAKKAITGNIYYINQTSAEAELIVGGLSSYENSIVGGICYSEEENNLEIGKGCYFTDIEMVYGREFIKLNNLNPNTKYYYRAFISNPNAEGEEDYFMYGAIKSFTTSIQR